MADFMKRFRCRRLLAAVLGVALWACSLSAWGNDPQRCLVCGMDVAKYPHSRYVVTTTDGQTHVTCGVQCGLTLHLRFKEKWRSAMATDLLSNRPFDAEAGFYVYKSSVITDMSPGFIAFKRREDAEKFARGFGGDVVTYQEALAIWGQRMN